MKQLYFNTGHQNDIVYYYFPFFITMEKLEDKISINTFLPGQTVNDQLDEVLFHSGGQVKRMYNNSIIYDLEKDGYTNVSISDYRGGNFQLNFTLGNKHNHTDVAKLYNYIRDLMDKFYVSLDNY